MEFFEIEGLEYLIQYPKDFSSDKIYPVLFFLHGAGTRGDSIKRVVNNPFFKGYNSHIDLPFVVVAPFCASGTWFDVWERLKKLALHIVSLPFADRNRIYIIGSSMGGYATWQLAMSLPELFAAIVPICGGGMSWNTATLKNIPVWAFHGALDGTVPVCESERMVNCVNNYGGNAKLTVYPEAAHNAWTPTFSNREVFEWMLSHRKSEQETKITDEYDNQKKFG